ncbi:MAG: cyclically-permuted mutarotase family protein, partial [Lentisphaeraceae bacterium]|nr:cyclically-permuted mutarotase family protein [Lentisphaeraceae bacterium]
MLADSGRNDEIKPMIKASILLFLFTLSVFASDKNLATNIIWENEKLSVPAPQGKNIQNGLSNPFAGVHNGVLLVGGGANFPDKNTSRNSKKVYHQSLFAYDLKMKKWYPEFQLPTGLAYGKSISTEDGLICIGGTNGINQSNKVFKIHWNPKTKKPEFTDLPDLPVKIHSFGATLINNQIFVFSGMQNGTPGNKTFKLLLNNLVSGWQQLADMPGKARIQTIAIAQNGDQKKDLIYLFGGHSRNNIDIYVATTYLTYNPETDSWSNEENILPKGYKSPISLGGAQGIKVGAHHILFVGGYDKDIFKKAYEREWLIKKAKTEGNVERVKLLKEQAKTYLLQDPTEYNWNRKVLAFHTVTGSWHVVDEYPHPPPCGAPIIQNGNNFYIVNGETKPGIRSPFIYSFSFSNKGKFHIVDYVILILYLLGMLYLGLYFMRRENGTEDFFKGGGRIPWWAAGISIFATMLSSISFMAIPALTYISDWKYFTMAITILLMAPVIIHYYLPFFRKLNVTSAYEYLERRFNIETRILGSLSFIIFMIARVAIVLYLPALALAAVTGISIISCILIIGFVTIIYCVTGGIEAVVWGDVIQGAILVIGALVAIGFLISNTTGGVSGVLEIANDHQKMAFLDMTFDLSKPVFWVVLIGGLVNNLTSYSSDQSVIQRYVTTSDDKNAAKSIWLNGILSIPISLILYFIGTALFAFYQDNPELLNINMAKNDSIFPTFIVESLPVGISG